MVPVVSGMIRFLQLFSAILTGLGLASCASTTLRAYEGPARPDSEIAVIRGERTLQNRLAAQIRIMSIDSPRGDAIPINTRGVSVLPGDVCLGVLATTSTMDQETTELCFDASPGSTYEIRVLVAGIDQDLVDSEGVIRSAQRGPFRVARIWIVDAGTSRTVAVFTP